MARLHLFSKYPRAGAVKTRLIPALGAEGAARLHRRLTERAIGEMRASGLDFEVRYAGADEGTFARWLGDVTLTPQGEGDLGDRLGRMEAPGIAIGADIPDLTADHMRQAAAALEEANAVIGPAHDGGYYLIGLVRPMPFLWTGMPWGTDAVLGETIDRLDQHGIKPVMLEMLHDLDRPEDLVRWPEFAA